MSDPIQSLAQALISLSRPNSRPASPTPSAPSLEGYTVPLTTLSQSTPQELQGSLSSLQSVVVEQTEDQQESFNSLEALVIRRSNVIIGIVRHENLVLQQQLRSIDDRSACQSGCILWLHGIIIIIVLAILIYHTFMDKLERIFG